MLLLQDFCWARGRHADRRTPPLPPRSTLTDGHLRSPPRPCWQTDTSAPPHVHADRRTPPLPPRSIPPSPALAAGSSSTIPTPRLRGRQLWASCAGAGAALPRTTPGSRRCAAHAAALPWASPPSPRSVATWRRPRSWEILTTSPTSSLPDPLLGARAQSAARPGILVWTWGVF